ncbi:MAG: helix-hairpin-helix domain-containing protein [Bacteroidetes bacterium]|nr:helix-hairpin-helix domain-containing protein [Bacteroidota bacterium]
MKVSKRSAGFLLVFLFSYFSIAQRPDEGKTLSLEDLIEEIASNSDEELDYTTLYDDLNFFLNNPLNLNEATAQDLEKLQFLNDFQVQSLLKYREKYGKFLTIYELQLLNGYSVEDISRLLPFVSVGKYETDDGFSIGKAVKYGNHQVFLRGQQVLEEQKGYSDITNAELASSPNSRYLGSPQRIYARYKYQYKNKLYWGITAEKDPGEVFFKNNVNEVVLPMVEDKIHSGFDYYTYHFQINDIGPVKTIAVGDFQAQFGQGLTVFSGMSYGKSPYVLNIKKKAQKIRRYSSTDENLYMKGAGVTVGIKNIDVSAFASYRKLDANASLTDTIDDDEYRIFSSIQETGYHTTPGELEDKDELGLFISGGNVSYHREKYKLGMTGVYYKYSDTIRKTSSMYNQYDFGGIDNYNLGMDYQFVLKQFNFFGEFATCKSGGIAYVNGAMFNMAPQVSVSLLHRAYDPDYHAPYANAFAEGSAVANEHGLYFGTVIYPIKRWSLTAYYDIYSFPWMKSRVYAPSHGQDYFIQTDYSPSRFVQMYLRFKHETKQQNADDESSSPTNLEDVGLMKLRYHLAYSVSKTVQMKNRVEFARYFEGENEPEKGYMIYQDIIYRPQKLPLSLAFRYAVFDATYNARIYAYESDVLYAFSIPAYNYKGTRFYITMKYTIIDGLDIWLRFGQFYYKDQDVISSGLTEIQGHTKSEVKVQVRYKF